MATLITYEKLDELVFGYVDQVDDPLDLEALAAVEPTPEQHMEFSRTAELWATSSEFELENDTLRIVLFLEASGQANEGADSERALAMARQAVAAAEELGDWMSPDVRIRLFECLARAGHDDESASLEKVLRRGPLRDLESFGDMGEVLSNLGRDKQAERWYNMGIRFAEKNELTEEFDFEFLVVARSEVRGRLELPVDDYDVMARNLADDWDEEAGF